MSPGIPDFEGRWTVGRRIDDRLGGGAGRFDGQAVFEAAKGGLAYRETGVLTLDTGITLRAERRYLWRADGGQIAVDHADGRAFHRFDPADPGALYDCAPDSYRVRYDFSEWPCWTSVWEVEGPRKDHRLTTRYQRADAD
jgi:hypothetical protein